MDKAEKVNWTWMEQHMPQVVAMMRAERQGGRGALLGECWRRGVINDEPGWFYARENGVAVGVPSVEFVRDPNQAALLAMFPNAAVLLLKGSMIRPEPPPAATPPQGLTRKQQRVQEILHGAD